MGGHESITGTSDVFEVLLQEDKSQDPGFWSDLLRNAPSQESLERTSPLFFDQIVAAQPRNAEMLLTTCVKFLEHMSKGTAAISFPKSICGKIAFVTNTFATGWTVAISRERNRLFADFLINQTQTDDLNSSLAIRAMLAISNLLFKDKFNPALEGDCEVLPTVRVLLHTLLLLIDSKSLISNQPTCPFSVSLDSFPLFPFVNSLCLTLRKFPNEVMIIRHYYAIANKLFVIHPGFQAFLSQMRGGSIIIHPTLINISSPVFTEALSFAFVFCLSNKVFIEHLVVEGRMPSLLESLFSLNALSLEKYGPNFVHKTILSVILLLVEEDLTFSVLNQPFTSSMESHFRPHRGTYGTVLIENVMLLSKCEYFRFSIACIIHALSSKIKFLSSVVSQLLIEFYADADRTRALDTRQTILEAFCEIIRSNSLDNSNFLLFVVYHSDIFKSKEAKPTSEQLYIAKYNSLVKRRLLEKGRKTFSPEEAVSVIESINNSLIQDQPSTFVHKPYEMNEKIRETWLGHCDKVFKSIFKKEIALLEVLPK